MFFLFPVGHKDTTVERQPWVSYAIIALNVLIFLFFTHDGLKQAETKKYLVEIFNYSIEHPNVEWSPEFRKVLPEYLLAQYDRARVKYQEIVRKPGEVALLQEQAHIDELTEAFLSAYQKDSYHQWGYIPSRQGYIHTLVSNIFFHAGFLHLLGNMFLFYLCGPFIEDRWGKPIFATFYIACGIVSSSFYGWLTDTPNVPLIGASGAIAGLIGVFLIKFFHTKIKFLYVCLFWFRLFKGTFYAPAYAVIPLWFFQQYYNAVTAVHSNVAFWAHVGGFIFGVAVTLGLKFSNVEERYISPLVDGKVTSFKSRPLFEKALQEWAEGRPQEAIQILEALLKDDPNHTNIMQTLLQIYIEIEDSKSIQHVGSKFIMALLKNGEFEQANDVYRTMNLKEMRTSPLPDALFSLAVSTENSQGMKQAYQVYEELISNYPKTLLAFKSLVKLAKFDLETRKDYLSSFSHFVLAKNHPKIDHTLDEMIEKGMHQARKQGGPNAAFMREAEVVGLERLKEPPAQKAVQLNLKPALLIGLSAAHGLKLKDGEGSQFALPWAEIILYSIALVKSPSQAASDIQYSVYFDFFCSTHEDERVVCYEGFRLYSDQLPVRQLFKEDIPAADAYRKFARFLQKHMVNPGIPTSAEVKRFNLSRYDSASAYEESLTHQLSTFADSEETRSTVEL